MVCPQCQAEYRPGILQCADCGVPLGSPLPPPPAGPSPPEPEWGVVLASVDPSELLVATSALEAAGIPFVIEPGAQPFPSLATHVLVPRDRFADARSTLSTEAQPDDDDVTTVLDAPPPDDDTP